MSTYTTTDTELTSIANAIRTKGGTSSQLVYPNGFVSAINDIPSGGGYTITYNLTNCTASSSNPTTIGEKNIAELYFTPSPGYELAYPTITGASLRSRGSGVIEIENPTANVVITMSTVQPDYFWVENIGSRSASISSLTGFQYSTDKTTWNTGDYSLPAGGKVYLKGNIGKTVTNRQTPVPTSNSNQLKIGGNVFTLLDYSGILTDYTDACSSMFYDNKAIVDASELDLGNTLAPSCYYNMFWNCTSLTTAPELPATTLAPYCYYFMFGGCTSLTTAPELPATTLAPNCYYFMFYGCTALTTVPELPATTLEPNCYAYMFSGCSSLKVYSESGEGHDKAWSIPSEGVITGTTYYPQPGMFSNVQTDSVPSGFPGTVGQQFTYYTQNEPV